MPGTPEGGIPIKVAVNVDSAKAMIEVDLSDNPDTMPCGLNLSEGCARAAAMIGIFNSIEDPVPTNAGSFRRIKVHIRDGCIAGGGKHPVSMSVATTNLADRVTSPVQRAFAKISKGLGLAEAGPIFPASMAVISGTDPRHGDSAYVNQIFLIFTGGAASALNDSWVTLLHAGNAGMSFIDSVELDELHFPILVKGRYLEIDSEGAGRTIGAPSGFREYGPYGDNEMEVVYVADGAINGAKGIWGGADGAKNRNYHRTVDGKLNALPPMCDLILKPGETVVSYCSGGAGYGEPRDRPVEKVHHDVAEGWVSRDKAAEIYGVVIDAAGQIDAAATDRLRSRD